MAGILITNICRHPNSLTIPDPHQPFCLLSSWWRRSDLGTNHLTGDNDLDAAILLSTRSRAVVRHWIGFAKTSCSHRGGAKSLRGQVCHHAICALLRERRIEVGAACAVGVSLNGEMK